MVKKYKKMEPLDNKKEIRFITDATLGKLAKWLRILGYDTLFFRESDIDSLIKKARKEKRIILTKNTAFHKKGISYQFIQSIKPLDQLREIIKKYQLREDNMFALCIICNTKLISVKKEKIRNKVPDFVFLNRERFQFCPECKKVFWPGTHREGMRKKILSIIQED